MGESLGITAYWKQDRAASRGSSHTSLGLTLGKSEVSSVGRWHPNKKAKNARRFLVDVAKSVGVPIRSVLTDNGKEFRSSLFSGACQNWVSNTRERNRGARTNGKVGRFHRTEEDELFCRTFSSAEERETALEEFLRYYKLHSSLRPREVCRELGGRKSA